jgi:hypothetical protein
MVTIQFVIDTILAAIPGSTTTDTVDTIKAGTSQPVKGIVTTFLASQAVLKKLLLWVQISWSPTSQPL